MSFSDNATVSETGQAPLTVIADTTDPEVTQVPTLEGKGTFLSDKDARFNSRRVR